MMEDNVPKAPDLKDLIPVDEAAAVRGCSFEDMEDLIRQGKVSSHDVEGCRMIDRSEVERLKGETDLLQQEISDNS